jgi:crooked neck
MSSHVSNRVNSSVQITAEQIIHESQSYKPQLHSATKQLITSQAELLEHKARKRKEFEDLLRRHKQDAKLWLKYAAFEADYNETERVRSIYERALQVNYKNPAIWLKYIEFEQEKEQISHARNLFDRVTVLLPLHDQFWYKYVHQEELIGQVDKARQVFQRWLVFKPNRKAWISAVNFEIRHNQLDNARNIFEQLLSNESSAQNYISYAKFELKQANSKEKARRIYEKGYEKLQNSVKQGENTELIELLLGFAQFEQICREFDRCRALFRYILDELMLSKPTAERVYSIYSRFEREFGDSTSVEQVILAEKRIFYEKQLQINHFNYDNWVELCKLEETCYELAKSSGVSEEIVQKQLAKCINTYERAISVLPPAALQQDRHSWSRYIYLWLFYAAFVELATQNFAQTKAIYTQLTAILPHSSFSFAKLWLLHGEFMLRWGQVSQFRQIFGQGLGVCGQSTKLYAKYIEYELLLGNIDRCRALFQQQIAGNKSSAELWLKFAAFERNLEEFERCLAIFQLCLAPENSSLDMPELVWKAYIEQLIEMKQWANVASAYEQLLQRTQHLKVWLANANFFVKIKEFSQARAVLKAANDYFIQQIKELSGEAELQKDSILIQQYKADRCVLLEKWLEFEQLYGASSDVDTISKLLPQVVHNADGSVNYVYNDLINPAANQQQFNIMHIAKQWKLKQQQAQQGSKMEEKLSSV